VFDAFFELAPNTGKERDIRSLKASKQPQCRGALFPMVHRELLDILRKILRKHGSLSRKIIDDEPGAPPTATYQYRFGGILPAYKRIGYDLQRRRNRSLKDRTKSMSNTQLLDLLRKLRRRQGRLSARLIDETKGLPAVSTFHARFGNLSRAYQLIGYGPKRLPLGGRRRQKAEREAVDNR
jgi:hypothetical protein